MKYMSSGLCTLKTIKRINKNTFAIIEARNDQRKNKYTLKSFTTHMPRNPTIDAGASSNGTTDASDGARISQMIGKYSVIIVCVASKSALNCAHDKKLRCRKIVGM